MKEVLTPTAKKKNKNILEEDNIEHLLMSTYDGDTPLDRNLDVGNDLMSEPN